MKKFISVLLLATILFSFTSARWVWSENDETQTLEATTLGNCLLGSETNCQTCKGGFQVKNGGCVACSLQNCMECPGGSCRKCFPSFSLYNNQCLSESRCKSIDSKCVNCDGSNKCTECSYNWKPWDNGKRCGPMVDDVNCLRSVYDNLWQCAECKSGLYLINGKCLTSRAENCLIYNTDGTCQRCKGGFYDTSGQCKACTVQNCMECYGTSCRKCFPSFSLINNQCLSESRCKSIDTNCVNCDGGKCTECSYNWKPWDNGKRCGPMVDDANCLKSKYDNFWQCAECKSGLFLINGKCLTSRAENCLIYNTDGTCQRCKGGFYETSGQCKGCPAGCMECYGTSCRNCFPDHNKNGSGQCIKK